MTHRLSALLCAVPLLAQSPLSLGEAVRTALAKHPALEAAGWQTRAADSRVAQARAGFLPRVSYTESYAHSDNPVFVFSSLLTQHQFTENNFRVGPLNRPDFLNNFQSQVQVEQTIWDWGQTRAMIRGAELGRDASRETERGTRMALIARAVRAYYSAVLAQAGVEVAREALKSAEADLNRAETVRQAGMATDADVLAIRVHLASVREAEIRRIYDVQVAIAALNEALGQPLDTRHDLTTKLSDLRASGDVAMYEDLAGRNRPEVKQTELAASAAEQQVSAAKSARLPQFGIRGAFEANRQEFVRKGGANWLIAASMRWTLFNGFSDRARVSEAQAALSAARAQMRQVNAGLRLEVHRAWADAKASEERVAAVSTAVAQAEENLRITKNRFEAGLTPVTELLRSETALSDAKIRRLAAIHDGRVALIQLQLAAGTLSEDSEVLK
jgi:outer membrane protein TolC